MPGVRVGRRVYATAGKAFDVQADMVDGDFFKDAEGVWWARPPRCGVSVAVKDAEDRESGAVTGRVTVPPAFDGWLRNGMWHWGTP